MRNRIPTYPGRVHLAPVEGQANVFDLTRADQPQDPGTPLNKGTLLSDDVEALIWGAAADRTPNDAFGKVSELYQHWWSILHGQAYSYWEDVKTPITAATLMIDGSNTYANYSKTVTISDSGSVSLSNPTLLDVEPSLSSLTSFCKTLAELAPVYFETTKANGTKTLYYLPAGATYKAIDGSNPDHSYSIFGIYDSPNNGVLVYLGYQAPEAIRAATVSSQLITVPAGETTYVHSPDRSAYPDSGTVDGMTYKYLGVPFDNARSGIKMEMVSYTGTGLYGSGNKSKIAFANGLPTVAMALGWVESSGIWYGLGTTDMPTSTITMNMIYPATLTTSPKQYCGFSRSGSASNVYANVTEDAQTIEWYSTSSASQQLNVGGSKYWFLGFYF